MLSSRTSTLSRETTEGRNRKAGALDASAMWSWGRPDGANARACNIGLGRTVAAS